MKISNITNDNLVIQARTEKDFEKAEKVADIMAADNNWMVVCSECDWELWVQLTARWLPYRAGEFKDKYHVAKKKLH